MVTVKRAGGGRIPVECVLCGLMESQIVLASLPRTAPPLARMFEHLIERHGFSADDIRSAVKEDDGAGWIIWSTQKTGAFLREWKDD